jgi:hypothetical protein
MKISHSTANGGTSTKKRRKMKRCAALRNARCTSGAQSVRSRARLSPAVVGVSLEDEAPTPVRISHGTQREVTMASCARRRSARREAVSDPMPASARLLGAAAEHSRRPSSCSYWYVFVGNELALAPTRFGVSLPKGSCGPARPHLRMRACPTLTVRIDEDPLEAASARRQACGGRAARDGNSAHDRAGRGVEEKRSDRRRVAPGAGSR